MVKLWSSSLIMGMPCTKLVSALVAGKIGINIAPSLMPYWRVSLLNNAPISLSFHNCLFRNESYQSIPVAAVQLRAGSKIRHRVPRYFLYGTQCHRRRKQFHTGPGG